LIFGPVFEWLKQDGQPFKNLAEWSGYQMPIHNRNNLALGHKSTIQNIGILCEKGISKIRFKYLCAKRQSLEVLKMGVILKYVVPLFSDVKFITFIWQRHIKVVQSNLDIRTNPVIEKSI
jgi:hypothetical protein